MQLKLRLLVSLLFLTIIAIILNVFSLKESNSFEIKSKQNYESKYMVSSELADVVLNIANNYDNNNQVNNIVYDGLTLQELSDKLDRHLNSTLSGKGALIASYSLEKGVDPYLAISIMLQETGCKWECSYIVKQCNNVGGMIGYGCGSYSYFDTLDLGIMSFIDNLYSNYIAYGLTTPETINPKYAEDQNWAFYVNNYINEVRE